MAQERRIRIFGDPVLNTQAGEITTIDQGIKTLAEDMLATMDANSGVGLAANQIGVLLRIFVYDCTSETPGARGAIINPVWEPVGDETEEDFEGCLSIPEITQITERYEKVRVRGLDLDGNEIDMTAQGLFARCVQHETDHLDGVLFIKRLTPERRRETMREIRASEWFGI